MYNNHRILIDRIDEYGMDGELATSKRMITVIRYGDDNLTPMIFNVSPYTPLVDMHTMARVWIDCGCPSDGDANGIPRKWTKEDLHAWVAG
tara:strand:- start:1320 stop:1592 length:273 start_codon:yes stop_codon:yes gene_type:complete